MIITDEFKTGWITYGFNPNCKVTVGKNVIIDPFVAIGYDGFGFKKDKDKFKIPLERNEHKFGVVIEDDVEIGPNTCIDRGSWRDTIIGKGTKIDNNVHVAHNVIIGKHNLIVAGTVIGGSCEIGDECFLGINSAIKQHVKIGNNVTVGMGAVVLKNVPDNTTIVGNPGRRYFKPDKLENHFKWEGMKPESDWY